MPGKFRKEYKSYEYQEKETGERESERKKEKEKEREKERNELIYSITGSQGSTRTVTLRMPNHFSGRNYFPLIVSVLPYSTSSLFCRMASEIFQLLVNIFLVSCSLWNLSFL